MSAAWPYRVTIAVPEADVADANALALVLGEVPGDAQTFGELWAQDVSGNRYAIACTHARSDFPARAQATPLSAPSHAPGADIAAAARAQALLSINAPETPPTPAPARIAVVLGPNDKADVLPDHLAALGLTVEVA